MSVRNHPFRPAMIPLAMIALATTPARADVRNDDLFARLSVHVRSADMPDETARKVINEALAARDASSDDESLMVEVLALMSPPFRAALDAYDDEIFVVTYLGSAPPPRS